MAGAQKRHAAVCKAKVALDAAKQTKTVAELAKANQVHPVQISQWKKQLLDGAYDEDRPHQSLGNRTPSEVYRSGVRAALSGGAS